MLRQAMRGWLSLAVLALVATTARAQSGTETFTATAAVKTGGGAGATSPLTLVVDHKMSPAEVDKFLAAYKTGGAAALRTALVGVKPTGSVKLAAGKPTPTRITLERTTDKGRLLTVVCDKPILFLGAGVPGAKPKAGYDSTSRSTRTATARGRSPPPPRSPSRMARSSSKTTARSGFS